MVEFCHLHNHSHYSLLDGFSTPLEIAEIVKADGQIAVAISDHGTMSGTLAFQEACNKHSIKAILGCEYYFVPSLISDTDDKKAERFHIVIHAKNQNGLEKMFQVSQRAWTNGFYYKGRIQWEDLEFMAPDVIALSGCMASNLCRLLMAGDRPGAIEYIDRFKRIFGEDAYIEIQPWNPIELNKALMDLANDFNLKVVPTIDCHYPTHHDKSYEETLLMMGQIPSLSAPDNRYAKEHTHEIKDLSILDSINHLYPNRKLRFDKNDNYVMSSDDVVRAFRAAGVDTDVYSGTIEIAEKCNANIETGRKLLPKFRKSISSEELLREIAELGLTEKGLNDESYQQRLSEEIKVITGLGFADYFLIVWDICAFADRMGIARGPGRGSVGGSLLAFALGITKVDPLKFNLSFERFINKDRISWPDIDMDFEDKRRDEIKEYIKKRWGDDNVASISTYGEFKAKGVIKDAARVFQIPYDRMNKLTPLFNNLSELKAVPDGRKFVEEHPHVLSIAERLENRVRNAGAHAAGVVIADRPLYQVCPLETRNVQGAEERMKVTAFTMDEVEKLGLIKFDILGLKALAVIRDCIEKIEERHGGIDITDDSLKCDDASVLHFFNNDSLVGIFQAEGPGYKELVSKMGIDSFNDLAASNALVRPGAMVAYGQTYIDCKHGKKEPIYWHENIKPVLEETYGTLVYQEQTMAVAQVLAGFSASEADTLRKIIGKKRDAAEFQPFYEKWMDGCQRFISAKVAQEIWDSIEIMSNYSFNKSHAVGYSMITYQTMWLKYYYPTEFIWACLTNENKNEDISAFLTEANRLGVDILPPDINRSDVTFSLEDNSIRFGLSNISGCGPGALQEILRKRPFNSFEQFRETCAKNKVRSNLVENLEKIGAFKEIGYDAGYDCEKYYLPIINWTYHAEQDQSMKDILTPCGEVGENNGYHFVRAMVKSTKRQPHYFRVEFEDSSGTFAVFSDDKQADIKKKDYVLALVGNKSLVGFCDAAAEEHELLTFIKELEDKYQPIEELTGNLFVAKILACRQFTSKKGNLITNVTVYDPFNGYRKLLMFSRTFEKYQQELQKWAWVVIRRGDKPDIIDGIITTERYKELVKN